MSGHVHGTRSALAVPITLLVAKPTAPTSPPLNTCGVMGGIRIAYYIGGAKLPVLRGKKMIPLITYIDSLVSLKWRILMRHAGPGARATS